MTDDELVLRTLLYWDDRGVLLNAPRRAIARGEPWARQGIATVALRWETLLEVRDSPVWPDFTLRARERSVGPVDYVTTLWRLVAGGDERNGLSIEQVARHADAFAHAVTGRGLAPSGGGGWAAAPDVVWEPVRTLPHRDRAEPILSPFRTRAVPSERVVRVWEARTPRWVGWLFGHGSRPTPRFVEHPSALVVGEEHLYASAAGVAVRVPLSALRACVEETSQRSQERLAIRLVFGRRTELRVHGAAWEFLRPLVEERTHEEQRVVRVAP